MEQARQSFSVSTLGILGHIILCLGGKVGLVNYRMLSSIPSLDPLDASSTTPPHLVDNVSRHYQMFPGDQNHPCSLGDSKLHKYSLHFNSEIDALTKGHYWNAHCQKHQNRQ